MATATSSTGGRSKTGYSVVTAPLLERSAEWPPARPVASQFHRSDSATVLGDGCRGGDSCHDATTRLMSRPVFRPEEWSRWIRADLAALTGIIRLPIVGFGGGLTIDIGGDCNLSGRYTTVPGPAVESAGLLRLRPRPASPRRGPRD